MNARRAIATCVVLASCLAGGVSSVTAGETRMMTWCDRTDVDPQACVTTLCERFAARGPAAFVQIGTQLSKALVAQPEVFFEAMASDPLTFNDWKNSLAEHTFRVSAKPGTLESELQSAYLARLRELMRESAQAHARGTPWAGMAQDVASALDDVTIAAR